MSETGLEKQLSKKLENARSRVLKWKLLIYPEHTA